MEELSIEYVPIDSVRPYPGNAKEHPEEQIAQIMTSMKEFGNLDPIGVWHGQIVEGHGRYEAAKRLGYKEIPIIRLDSLTDEQRRAYGLVHNQLTMNTPFNLYALKVELDGVGDIDLSGMGFDLTLHDSYTEGQSQEAKANEFFSRESYDGAAREEGNDEYNAFVEKFEPKKTTDDCYTPPKVYDAIADYVAEYYGVDRENFVRPFFPGGDYKQYKYSDGDIVVDNQPFSITAEILDYYNERGIYYFLFTPNKFCMNHVHRCCGIFVNVDVTFENGAVIGLSFLTNLENNIARTAPALRKAILEAQGEDDISLPVYSFPPEVCTFYELDILAAGGVDFSIARNEAIRIRALDSMKEQGKGIYGAGLLLSEKVAQAKEQAKEQAKRREGGQTARTIVWVLSDREREIIKSLS